MNARSIKRTKKLFEGYTSQKEHAKELEDKIEEIFHRLTNLKAITYDNIIGTTNTQAKEQQRLEMIDKKGELEKELEFVNDYIRRVENLLNQMPFQERIFFKMKYINHMSYDAIAYKLNFSSGSAVYKRMESILKKL